MIFELQAKNLKKGQNFQILLQNPCFQAKSDIANLKFMIRYLTNKKVQKNKTLDRLFPILPKCSGLNTKCRHLFDVILKNLEQMILIVSNRKNALHICMSSL